MAKECSCGSHDLAPLYHHPDCASLDLPSGVPVDLEEKLRERFTAWADAKNIGEGNGQLLPKGFLRETFEEVFSAGFRDGAALGRAEAMARIEELETELGELRFIFNNQELALKISRQQVEKARAEAIEMAAKIADEYTYLDGQAGQLANLIQKRVRALKEKG